MEQTGQQIFQFLSQYGYWVMLPLMIVEGPIATIFAATLAALGAFNVWIVLIFSILGDSVGDVLLYGAGYRWGMGFVRNFGKYIGITEKLVLKMEKYFASHGGKTIFAVKSTTGLCWATFTAAGIVKMDFRKFLKYSILGGIFLRLSVEGNQPIHRLDRLGNWRSSSSFIFRHNFVQKIRIQRTF